MNKTAETEESFLTSSHWGAGVAEVADGRIQAVHPHPDDPHPSRINENIPEGLHGRARVLQPAVRESYLEHGPQGPQGKRGTERFVQVSWDQVLDLIAAELARVRKCYGNEAIFAGSYGWASAGRFHHAQSQLKRFLAAAGGFVRSEGNYSYNAALVLMPYIVGNFRDHVRQVTRWPRIASDGELVVMFGGIALRNAKVSGGGVGRHLLDGMLERCAEKGVRFINISPLRRDAANTLGAEWLAPRPGSDAAIMMGLAHTLLVEGLHDKDFLSRYTVGFDTFADYLLGKRDGIVKDAAWAAEQSGLSADRLRALAREMASKRTLICTAISLQRADYGEQPLWMTLNLAAMLGQIGLPGGGFGIGYGGDASIGTADRPFSWSVFPQGKNAVDSFIPVAMISEMLLNPGGVYDYDGRRHTFPDIRLLWWAGGNPFHHHQDLNKLQRAFQRPETIIVNEISWTATARHADIVLPVAAPQERSDFGAGNQDNSLIPMPKILAPVGAAREEFDVYCDLEKRLSFGTGFSRGMTAEAWQEEMWEVMRGRAAANGLTLPQWNDFMKGDVVTLPDPHSGRVYLEDFRRDPEGYPLTTPSGKIEMASKTIASFGYEDCPGHPTWLPPREWLGTATENYPLHLISGQPATRLHSQLDIGAFSQANKVQGREPILVNPLDAASRGIKDGDVVCVFNQRGRCLAGAVVSEDIRQGVVFLWTGAWYDPDLDDPDRLDRHGNPNVLTHDRRTSRLSQGPAAQSALVQLEKFSGRLPEVLAYEPPIFPSPT
ncbi:MAG: molybdopterin-dependent oxidoreductase [Pseudomonadota bacterium]